MKFIAGGHKFAKGTKNRNTTEENAEKEVFTKKFAADMARNSYVIGSSTRIQKSSPSQAEALRNLRDKAKK
jgi:hypothetical protein